MERMIKYWIFRNIYWHYLESEYLKCFMCYLMYISHFLILQDKAKMEAYAQSKGWTTFDEMQADRKELKANYETMEKSRSDMTERMSYLQKLFDFNDEYYEPYHKFNLEYWKLKGAEDKNGNPLGFFKKSAESGGRI